MSTNSETTPVRSHEVARELADAGAAASGDEPVPSKNEAKDMKDLSLRDAVTDGIGGIRGMVESTVPVVVFVGVNIFTGLRPAIWAAVGVAALIAMYRLLRRDSIRHAVTGALGVAFAAMIAAKTGNANNFFLPGIITNFVYAGAFLVSIIISRPLVGYAWSLVTGAHADWRERPGLLRVFSLLSWVWVAVFTVRGGVQLWLYLADMTLGLGIARIVGIAPYAAALAFTVWYGRRAVASEEQQAAR